MMKNTKFFSIMACMILMITNNACEKADIQKTPLSDNTKIENRNVPDDCNDCPVGDCCCLVTLTGGLLSATLIFCGTDDPDVSATQCETSAGQCDIMGYTVERTIPIHGGAFFCMQPNTAFCLQGSPGAQLSITCQYGLTNPQTITPTLGTNKVYFTANGDCELVDCN